jgi:hypothetical protein
VAFVAVASPPQKPQQEGSQQGQEQREEIGDAVIEVIGDRVYVRAPYDRSFVEALKSRSKTREWNPIAKAWVVDISELDLVRDLVKQHFSPMQLYRSFAGFSLREGEGSIEVPAFPPIMEYVSSVLGIEPAEKLGRKLATYRGLTKTQKDMIKKKAMEVMDAIEKDMEKGERIYIFEVTGKSYFVSNYARDWAYFVEWWSPSHQLFRPLNFLRIDHGSRRYPTLYGYLAIVSRVDPRLISTEFAKNPERVVELPGVPEAYEIVDKAFKEAKEKGLGFEELANLIKNMAHELLQPQQPPPQPAAEEAAAAQAQPAAVGVVEIKPRELELEPIAPAVQPAAVVAEAPRQQLVKLYILAMTLPSKYLVQEVQQKEGEEIRTWSGVRGEIASKLEGIRREAYERANRSFVYIDDLGLWVAVTDDAVEKAREISKYVVDSLKGIEDLRKILGNRFEEILRRYGVKAIEIYLKPEDAKEILKLAERKLLRDIEELRQRIADAERENNKRLMSKYMREEGFKKNLLDSLRKYMETI